MAAVLRILGLVGAVLSVGCSAVLQWDTGQCGDDVVQGLEECDDGNRVDGDGCSATCTAETICGDGITQTAGGEECDDGGRVGGDGCSADCKLETVCGDGVVEGAEECDEGTQNANAPDRCRPVTCKLPFCTDGIRDSTEMCDDGNQSDADGCTATCETTSCGDGILRTDLTDPNDVDYEACDDGNVALWDGCSATCRIQEFQVNTTTAGIQNAPRVAVADDGRFAVTWVSFGGPGEFDVYARVFDAVGDELIPEFVVNETVTGWQTEPVVAMSGDGRFAIAWASNHSGDKDVYVRAYDAAGLEQTAGEVRVNQVTANDQGGPSIAMDDQGRFVVAFSSFNGNSFFDIVTRGFTPGGAPSGSEFAITVMADQHQFLPAVAMRDENWVGYAWEGIGVWRDFTQQQGVYANVADVATQTNLANPWEWGLESYTAPDDPINIADITMDSQGRFIVCYQHYVPSFADVRMVRCARFEPIDATFRCLDQTNYQPSDPPTEVGFVRAPRVSMADDGRHVVAYRNPAAAPDGVTFAAKLYDWDLTPQGTEFILHTYRDSDVSSGDVAMLPNGHFVAVWAVSGIDGDQSGIMAQRFSSAGVALGKNPWPAP